MYGFRGSVRGVARSDYAFLFEALSEFARPWFSAREMCTGNFRHARQAKNMGRNLGHKPGIAPYVSRALAGRYAMQWAGRTAHFF